MFPNNKRLACALFSKLSLAFIAGAALTLSSSSLFATEAGSLFVTDLATGSVIVYDPTGAGTTFDTGLTSPQGIVFDHSQTLYVADAGDGTAGAGTIFKYDLSVGGSRVPFRTGLNNPQGLAFDGSAILVSENGEDRVLRLPVEGGGATILQTIPTPLGLAAHGLANQTGLYKFVCNGPLVRQIPPLGGSTTDFDFSADGSRAATVSMVGNLFVSTDTGKVIGIEPGSVTQTLIASGFTQPTGMDFRPARFGGDTDRVGFLYVADTATGTISQISIAGEVTPFVTDAGMPNYVVFQTIGATPLPVVVTGVASAITDTTATLNGTVNPSGSETTYHFEYGLTTSYGSTTTITSAGSGFTAVAVSAALTGLISGTEYHFRVTATNSGGTANGEDATFTAGSDTGPMPPIVVTGVASNIGDTTATLGGTVNPAGSETTYQFEYGLTTSYGSTTTSTSAGSGFTAVPVSAELTDLSAATVYHFRVTATNASGTSNGADATFTTADATPAAGKAQNLSTRVDVETGVNLGIGGFIITGTDPKLVVIRAIGPSLTDFGVAGALADPVLELHDSTGAIIATNDNHGVIGHGLDPTNPLESAIITTLDPGLYTAVVSGKDGGTGVALIEMYDLDDPGAAGELANLSTRGFVGTETNVMIGGLIVGPEGGVEASVVVRALGPSLADFGITDPLLDPVLELRDGNGDLVAMNDNWETDPPPDNFSVEVTAADLAPSDASESAIFANLTNGLYTAIVTGKDSTTGVGLVEVYHVAAQTVNSALH